MDTITVKEYSERFRVNLAKARRWTREFLPPDPKAIRRSGYARTLTQSEAFEVFLGGHLVSMLGCPVQEAKQIIRDLTPWLKEEGFYPSAETQPKKEAQLKRMAQELRPGRAATWDRNVNIEITQHERNPLYFHYSIREVLSSEVENREEKSRIIVERRKITDFFGQPVPDSESHLKGFSREKIKLLKIGIIDFIFYALYTEQFWS